MCGGLSIGQNKILTMRQHAVYRNNTKKNSSLKSNRYGTGTKVRVSLISRTLYLEVSASLFREM
jgi:hypothetical protein